MTGSQVIFDVAWGSILRGAPVSLPGSVIQSQETLTDSDSETEIDTSANPFKDQLAVVAVVMALLPPPPCLSPEACNLIVFDTQGHVTQGFSLGQGLPSLVGCWLER